MISLIMTPILRVLVTNPFSGHIIDNNKCLDDLESQKKTLGVHFPLSHQSLTTHTITTGLLNPTSYLQSATARTTPCQYLPF